MMFLMFGGKFPEDGDDNRRSWYHYLGTREFEHDCRVFLEPQYTRSDTKKELDWFQVVSIEVGKEPVVVYDDMQFDAYLQKKQKEAELKAIEPESFLLFVGFADNFGHDSYRGSHSTFRDALREAKRCHKHLRTSLKAYERSRNQNKDTTRWQIVSIPQNKIIVDRINGFPGHSFETDQGQLSCLIGRKSQNDQLIDRLIAIHCTDNYPEDIAD